MNKLLRKGVEITMCEMGNKWMNDMLNNVTESIVESSSLADLDIGILSFHI